MVVTVLKLPPLIGVVSFLSPNFGADNGPWPLCGCVIVTPNNGLMASVFVLFAPIVNAFCAVDVGFAVFPASNISVDPNANVFEPVALETAVLMTDLFEEVVDWVTAPNPESDDVFVVIIELTTLLLGTPNEIPVFAGNSEGFVVVLPNSYVGGADDV